MGNSVRCISHVYKRPVVDLVVKSWTFLHCGVDLTLSESDCSECLCWALPCVVVPMNGTGPMRYLFRMDPESKYLQLREKLSELCGTPVNQIAFMDVGGGVVRVGGSVLQHLSPLVLLFGSNASN